MSPGRRQVGPLGLAPAIVQDAASGEVLMLAWMNRESLRLTLATGFATFWSRSRASCGSRAPPAATPRPSAPCGSTAIRTPSWSASTRQDLPATPERAPASSPASRCATGPPRRAKHWPLSSVCCSRGSRPRRKAPTPPSSSRTRPSGTRKVAEEAAELVIASLRGNRQEIAQEAADLLYHALVLLRSHDNGPR